MRFLAPVVDVHQDEADGCGPVAGETWRTPLEGGRFVFLLSGTLAATSALGAALDLFHLGEMVLRASSLLLIVAWGGATALVVAYGCRFLDSVVAYSLCGGAKSIDLPDHDSRSAIISLARWILCFFPVPAFLISFAIRCLAARTEFGVVEALILTALSGAAVTCWMLGRLLFAARRELDSLSPFSILTAVRALGWRAVPAVTGVTAACAVHAVLAASALDLFHRTWLAGFVLLWFCWFSAWQCGTYALWTLGIWLHRATRVGGAPGRRIKLSLQAAETGARAALDRTGPSSV